MPVNEQHVILNLKNNIDDKLITARDIPGINKIGLLSDDTTHFEYDPITIYGKQPDMIDNTIGIPTKGVDKTWDIIGAGLSAFVASPLLAYAGETAAASAAPSIIANTGRFGWKVLNHPITQTIGTVDGIKNLFTNNGVQKTYNHFKNEEYGRGMLSLSGDILDASPLIGVTKVVKPNLVKRLISNKHVNTAIDNIRTGQPINHVKLLDDIEYASKRNLENLENVSRNLSGEQYLISPVIRTKLGELSIYDLYYAAKQVKKLPDSPFIQKATNIIKDGRYIGDLPPVIIDFANIKSIPAKKYVSHSITSDKLRSSIDNWDSATPMPSLSIRPTNGVDNFFYGDVIFIGDKNLLHNSIIYNGDAYTPAVKHLDDVSKKSITDVYDELKSRKVGHDLQILNVNDLDNIHYNQHVLENSTINNSYMKFYQDKAAKTLGSPNEYLEAKYQNILPFSEFKHVFIPYGSNDLIKWSIAQKIPYTIYNKPGEKGIYTSVTDYLKDNPNLTFKLGGKLK